MLSFLIHAACYAQIKLPKLISDGMVLQHSQELKIWGWAAPQENISLHFNNKDYKTKANAAGEWSFAIPPQKAGGTYNMVFAASNKVEVNNITFGDVWLCSGQSNMELGMGRLMDTYPEEATAVNPEIRQFLVPDVYNFKVKQTDLSSGSWQSVSPKTIREFSGVAYFFAVEIYKKQHIPIGIINAALGGSPAQAWISEPSIKKFPEYYNDLQSFKDDNLIAKIESENKLDSDSWYAELNKKDEGLKKGWKASAFDDSKWETMNIPGYWPDGPVGEANGSVWFRKVIDVPAAMAGVPAKLILGRIIDADSVFVNNVFVGSTSYQYPPRKYALNNTVLKPGKNTIVVRVISNSGRGGFVLDKDYQIIAGNNKLNLQGPWKYKRGAFMPPTKPQISVRWKPAGLFNGMIAPLQNYAVKGVLWYQGESNAGEPDEYFSLMETLVADWRAGWKRDLPFIYVQLPGFMEEKSQPTESNWAALRDQQQMLLTSKNTAMAVAIDLGEWNDIHPLNKKEVGKRLALQADKLVYGDTKSVVSGPTFRALNKVGSKVIISFDNIGSGLTIKNGEALQYFAIAGSDKKYVWAKAMITGNNVEVWNSEVPNPVYVRYAWADNPAVANLYNKEGLPAAPFQASVK